MAGIYVHFPFCRSFCIYCDFYSQTEKGRFASYTEALLREMNARKGFFSPQDVPETLYFGGGTPSIVPFEELVKVADGIRSVFGPASFSEFTLEANPDDITPASLALWRKMGVNRLSIGVQSFNDAHLRWMRRRHDAARAKRAVKEAQDEGFDNISIDLIFGYMGLTLQEWEANVAEAVNLEVQHISCYQMTLESGSALGEMASRGQYLEPPQEECALQYALLQQKLSAEGFFQYEISNFAKPGFRSRHNSSYWNRSPYIGLGAAAHSFDGALHRSWNVADLQKYISCTLSGDYSSLSQGEDLCQEDVAEEIVMLGLRTCEGFDASNLAEPHLSRFLSKGDCLVQMGLLERQGTVFRIPSGKLFVSDDIISDLFI